MLILLAVMGCTWVSDKEPVANDTSVVDDSSAVDADEDGYVASEDCDDSNPDVHPDAIEVCDDADVDEDCDGAADDDDALGAQTWYLDEDQDGFGNPDEHTSVPMCSAPSTNHIDNADDCDDSNPDVNPDAVEVCDEVDNNCDGAVDEGVTTPYFRDADLDGYGDASDVIAACAVPEGYLEDATDCDDTDALVYPGAEELCDGRMNNCDDASEWSSANEDGLVFYEDDGVWSDISSDFSTPAVDYALASSGTYYFCAGTYQANLIANSDEVTLVGVWGRDATIISHPNEYDVEECSGLFDPFQSIVYVLDGSVAISGLSLVGRVCEYGLGGGVTVNTLLEPVSTVTITESTIRGNSVWKGGAIAVLGHATALVTNSDLLWNYVDYPADASGDYDGEGGGVWVGANAEVSIITSTIEGNTAVGYAEGGAGGGIYTEGGTVTLTDSVVYENSATVGGGIYVEGATVNLTNSEVHENTAAVFGGGFALATTAVVTLDCPASGGVYMNDAGAGGGAFLASTASLTVTLCDFGSGGTDNSPDDVGYFPATSYTAYGSGASFTCSGGACSE